MSSQGPYERGAGGSEQRGCDNGSRGRSDVPKGPRVKECRQPLGAGKAQQTDPPLLVLPIPSF